MFWSVSGFTFPRPNVIHHEKPKTKKYNMLLSRQLVISENTQQIQNTFILLFYFILFLFSKCCIGNNEIFCNNCPEMLQKFSLLKKLKASFFSWADWYF